MAASDELTPRGREETTIFFPQTINDLLSTRKQRPDAVPVAGGTWLLHNQSSRFLKLPKALITLSAIEELRRIGHSGNHVDIGACVPLNRILSTGKNILPQILLDTFESIATPGIRSLATLGGNICIQGRTMSTHPTLHILDARLEFRKAGGARWVPVTHSRTDGKLCIEPGEVLTRIRIPLENWNVQYFRRLGSNPISGFEDVLVFAAIARTSRAIISDLRFAIGSNHLNIYRNRDMETLLVGHKIPLSSREITGFLQNLEENLKDEQPGLSAFMRGLSLSLIRRLFSNLPAD
ncbi:MAG: FAD binding domain-containing protein [Spirochaetaceae bacterium]|jgi:CO/xanthine dehydrogenase FAD-binding subunit|nr:FAD binding domain-containing protein [Spirochaetaceae bacterium]